jgi:hypothetical protein
MNKRAIDALMVSCVLGLTCCGDVIEREAFCERMAQEICTRLFDDCSGRDASGELRYAAQSDCRAAEEKYCGALAAADSLTYDRQVAFSCVDQVASAPCENVFRSDFHACKAVFTELDRPSRPIDAGTTDGGGSEEQ